MTSGPTFHEGPRGPMPYHPLADIFPLILGDDYWALVEDVRKHGVLQPIVMLDGMVLDGRHRYLAAREAGVGYPTVEFEGDDPLGFVVSLNLKRRHLSESQRAMVAAKIAKLPKGANQHTPIGGPSQAAAAGLMNVGERQVQRAAVVRDHAVPELQGRVEAGAVAVSAASDLARLPPERQREIVAGGDDEISRAAKQVRHERRVERWQDRVAKLLERARQGEPDVSKPDLKLSIAAHLYVVGGQPETVKQIAEAAGVALDAIGEAIRILASNPEDLERQQHQTAIVLAALMSVEVQFEEVGGSFTYDISRAEALEEVWRKGWISGVLARPDDGGGHADGTEEAAVWREGRAAFQQALSDFMEAGKAHAA